MWEPFRYNCLVRCKFKSQFFARKLVSDQGSVFRIFSRTRNILDRRTEILTKRDWGRSRFFTCVIIVESSSFWLDFPDLSSPEQVVILLALVTNSSSTLLRKTFLLSISFSSPALRVFDHHHLFGSVKEEDIFFSRCKNQGCQPTCIIYWALAEIVSSLLVLSPSLADEETWRGTKDNRDRSFFVCTRIGFWWLVGNNPTDVELCFSPSLARSTTTGIFPEAIRELVNYCFFCVQYLHPLENVEFLGFQNSKLF